MKPQDRIHRSPGLSGAPGYSPDRPPMLLSHLGQHARLRLACGFCGWSRTYAPHALIKRLQAKGTGGPQTAIAHVARHVQWPCPMCHRMGWRTEAERSAAPWAPTAPAAAAAGEGGGPDAMSPPPLAGGGGLRSRSEEGSLGLSGSADASSSD